MAKYKIQKNARSNRSSKHDGTWHCKSRKLRSDFAMVTITLFILLELTSPNWALNVALRRRSTFCNVRKFSGNSPVFDGDRRPERFVSMTETCEKTAYLEVELGETYTIQYVVVYRGKARENGELDFFSVYNANDKTVDKCSEFPGPVIQSIRNHELRVNCRPSASLYNKVKVESRKNEGLHLSELEVHSHGNPNEGLLIHLGCYAAFKGVKMARGIGPKDCRIECYERGFTLLAMKNKHFCFCAHVHETTGELPVSRCDIECDDGQTYCGGNETYSVYVLEIPLPFYHGCIETRGQGFDSRFNTPDRELTVAKCIRSCENESHALMKEGHLCACVSANERELDMSNFKSCTLRCSGNGRQFCGGKAHASVYRTCSDGLLKCSSLMKCHWDMYGRCREKCAAGYRGEFCLERITGAEFPGSEGENMPERIINFDVAPLNPVAAETNPCEVDNPCKGLHTVCANHEGKAKCECETGYTMIKSDQTCEDLDECQFDPCDAETSTCENLDGSYECRCLQGLIPIGDSCMKNTTLAEMTFFQKYKSIIFIFLGVPFLSVLLFATIACAQAPEGTISDNEPQRN